MIKTFRFRVLIDHPDDIFRDIDISNNLTFKDLHCTILDAFEFDKNELASFYLSNEKWDKGEEIPLMNMDGSITSMVDTRISAKVNAVGDKLLYVYDFLYMWCFFIDLVGIFDHKKGKKLPCIVRKFGKSPDQMSKQIDIDNDFSMSIPEIPANEAGLSLDDILEESEDTD